MRRDSEERQGRGKDKWEEGEERKGGEGREDSEEGGREMIW